MVCVTERAEHVADHGGGVQRCLRRDAQPREVGQGGAEHGAPGGGRPGAQQGLLAARGRGLRREGAHLPQGLHRPHGSVQAARARHPLLDEHLVQEEARLQIPKQRPRGCSRL